MRAHPNRPGEFIDDSPAPAHSEEIRQYGRRVALSESKVAVGGGAEGDLCCSCLSASPGVVTFPGTGLDLTLLICRQCNANGDGQAWGREFLVGWMEAVLEGGGL
jgi:hypothetical protein